MKLKKKSSTINFDPSKLITTHEILGKKTKGIDPETGEPLEVKMFEDGGLFSKRIFGDVENTEVEYSCTCGSLQGKYYEGIICEKCGSEVVLTQPNINKTGWIDLTGSTYNEDGSIANVGNKYKIIKFIQYGFLEKIIGIENLRNIIHVPDSINIVGELDQEEIDRVRNLDPSKKYWYTGLLDFEANYKTILDYYYELNKVNNKELYDFVSSVEETFTDKIPVISALLRPAMRTSDGMKLDELNNIYIKIIKNVNMLNQSSTVLQLIKNSTLEMIQAEYFILSEYIVDLLRGKEGLFRNQIFGARLNFTARNIITPGGMDLKADEVKIPYRIFLELYKFELINIIRKIKGISLNEAVSVHFKASLEFNEELYNIMTKMINDNEVGILLNRNPTINIGSMLYLRIVHVKKDIEDVTLGISNIILSPLAGDYDGDGAERFC